VIGSKTTGRPVPGHDVFFRYRNVLTAMLLAIGHPRIIPRSVFSYGIHKARVFVSLIINNDNGSVPKCWRPLHIHKHKFFSCADVFMLCNWKPKRVPILHKHI